MKKIFAIIFAAAAMLTAFQACEGVTGSDDSEDDPVIPVYGIKAPITSATAVSGEFSVEGVIDNDSLTVFFDFPKATADLSNVTVTITVAEKATAISFTEPTVCDFSDGKTVDFVVNNRKEDVTYVMSAFKPQQLAVANPDLDAYAINKNGGVVQGSVDNDHLAINFSFMEVEVDVADIEVVISFDPDVTLGADAFTDKFIDLSSDYSFVVNDGESDLTYTIHNEFLLPSLVDSWQCAVVTGIEGEAIAVDPENKADGAYANYAGWDVNKTDLLNNPACLFDGTWMSKAEEWGDVEYHYFGQMFVGEEYNTWFVFDIGDALKVEHIQIMPYWPYSDGSACRQYEVYALIGSEPCPLGQKDTEGNMVVDTANWKLVAQEDISSWFDAQTLVAADKENKYGTDEDLCVGGSPANFFDDAPKARYYCFYQVSNMYSYGKEQCFQWWSVRTRSMTFSEFLVYAYQYDE